MVTIYILELLENKYYVGKTNNLSFRLDQHNLSNGSLWTTKYKPIKVLETYQNCDDYDEDKYTIKYMEKYGIDNVRGGSFCQFQLKKNEILTINKMIKGTSNKCYTCGKAGHFAKDCYSRFHKNKKQLSENITQKNENTISQLSENTTQSSENITQSSENITMQSSENITMQSSENITMQSSENIMQSSENITQSSENITQSSENITMQSEILTTQPSENVTSQQIEDIIKQSSENVTSQQIEDIIKQPSENITIQPSENITKKDNEQCKCATSYFSPHRKSKCFMSKIIGK